MYIVDFMSVTMLPDPDPQLELLALSVRYNNFKVNLYLFYCPPSSGSHIFDILVPTIDLPHILFLLETLMLILLIATTHPYYNKL